MMTSSMEKNGHETVVGCVLAGGLSRRMGGDDKPLLTLGGRPLLAHAVERLTPQVSALVLSANGDPARFADFELPVVADPVEGFAGPLAGVLAGMRWAQANKPDATCLVSAAADTPFFPHDLVPRLLGAAGNNAPTVAVAACEGTLHPVFALWPVALADDLENWLETSQTRKILAWVDRHPMVRVDFATTDGVDPFFNANTREDLADAEVLHARTIAAMGI